MFTEAMALAIEDIHQPPLEELTAAMAAAARTGLQRAAGAVVHGQGRRTWAAVVTAGAVAVALSYGAGWWSGWSAGAGVRAGAAVELAQLASQCQASRYQQSGGEACTVRVWLRAPSGN